MDGASSQPVQMGKVLSDEYIMCEQVAVDRVRLEVDARGVYAHQSRSGLDEKLGCGQSEWATLCPQEGDPHLRQRMSLQLLR